MKKESEVIEFELLASGRRVTFVVYEHPHELISVHLPSERMTSAEIEEINFRLQDYENGFDISGT